MRTLLAISLLIAVALPAVAATVTADGAINVTSSSAVLRGTVDPQGTPLKYVQFFFSAPTQVAFATPPQLQGVSTATSWSYTVTGLPCGTTFTYYAVAVYSFIEMESNTSNFTTAPCAFGVTTNPPQNVTSSTATLVGTVNPPSASSADAYFLVGWSDFLWPLRRSINTPVQRLSGSNVPFTETLVGLPCGMPIVYQAIAMSGSDTVFGARRNAATVGCTRVESDLNNDGRSDLMWRNPATGALEVWYYDGTTKITPAFPAALPTLASNIHVISAERDTGNGTTAGWSDLLTWNSSTGEVRRWPMDDGLASTSTFMQTASPATWEAVGSLGSSSNIIWRKIATNELLYVQPGSPGTWLPYERNSTLAGTSDFDGDGISDLLLVDSTGSVRVFLLKADLTLEAQYRIGKVLAPWVVAGAADFNLDGYPEVLIRNTTTGRTVAWVTMNSGGAIVVPYSFYLAPDGDPAKTLVLPN